jgi:hypothetical protein
MSIVNHNEKNNNHGLYGAGAYLTHRQAIGVVPASRTICEIYDRLGRNRNAPLGVMAFHVFIPLNDIKTMMHYDVLAVRNGDWKDKHGKKHPGLGEAPAKALSEKKKSLRSGWGLTDRTILTATKTPGQFEKEGIEEMTWYVHGAQIGTEHERQPELRANETLGAQER